MYKVILLIRKKYKIKNRKLMFHYKERRLKMVNYHILSWIWTVSRMILMRRMGQIVWRMLLLNQLRKKCMRIWNKNLRLLWFQDRWSGTTSWPFKIFTKVSLWRGVLAFIKCGKVDILFLGIECFFITNQRHHLKTISTSKVYSISSKFAFKPNLIIKTSKLFLKCKDPIGNFN